LGDVHRARTFGWQFKLFLAFRRAGVIVLIAFCVLFAAI